MGKLGGDLRKEDRYENLNRDEHDIKCNFFSVDIDNNIQTTLKKLYELGINSVTDTDSYECHIEKDEDGKFYVKIWTNDMGLNGHEFDFIANNSIILKYAIPKFIGAIKDATFFDAN